MRVFLCWSGPTSERIAKALHEWLDDIFHGIGRFMSTEDIQKGVRWQKDISEHLATTHLGIVCLTPDSRDAPWINFEAGALSRDLVNGRVTALLCGLGANDVRGPLAQFQNTPADKEHVFKLLKDINGHFPSGGYPRRPEDKLLRDFNAHWPTLQAQIREALATTQSMPGGSTNNTLVHTVERLEKAVEMLQEQVLALNRPPYSARQSPALTRKTPRRIRATRRLEPDVNQAELPFL